MDRLFNQHKSVDDRLRSAIQDAIDDLDSGLIGGVTDFWLRTADIAIELRRRLLVGPGDSWLDQLVAELLVEDPQSNPLEFIHVLNEDAKGESMAPFRNAIAIQLARGLIELLPGMQRRLYAIDAQLVQFPISPVARPYISTVMEAFLMNLDVGVLALARAGFEHAAQDWLVSSSDMQSAEIRKKSAGDLLTLLQARSAISNAAGQAALRIVQGGNNVMHRGGAAAVSEDDAVRAIRDLALVLSELVPRTSSREVG